MVCWLRVAALRVSRSLLFQTGDLVLRVQNDCDWRCRGCNAIHLFVLLPRRLVHLAFSASDSHQPPQGGIEKRCDLDSGGL